MMERICSTDGVVFYRSTLLAAAGSPHAFSTRIGGVSGSPFASLNLGNPSGQNIQDSPGNIRRNYERLLRAAGLDGRVLLRVSQVHGAQAVEAGQELAQADPVEADAIVTADIRCAASIRVADCVPVLLASRDGRRVAAVHAGWRGVVAGVIMRAMERLCGDAWGAPIFPDTPMWKRRPRRLDIKKATRTSLPPESLGAPEACSPGDIVAAVGPCIGFDAFEVGPEVVEQFVRIWGGRAPVRSAGDGKGRVDLRRAVRMQLEAGGLPTEQIDVSDGCTCRDAELFYSHRRDRGLTGRMAAVIAPARSPGCLESRLQPV